MANNMKVTVSGDLSSNGTSKTIDKLIGRPNSPVSGTIKNKNPNVDSKPSKAEETTDIFTRCKKLVSGEDVSVTTATKIILIEFKRLYLESFKGDGQLINIEWFRYTDEALFDVMEPIFKYIINRSILLDKQAKDDSKHIVDNMKEVILRTFKNANMYIEFDSDYKYDYTNFYRMLDRFFDVFN